MGGHKLKSRQKGKTLFWYTAFALCLFSPPHFISDAFLGKQLLAPFETTANNETRKRIKGNKKAVLWHSINFFLLTIPNSYKLLAKWKKLALKAPTWRRKKFFFFPTEQFKLEEICFNGKLLAIEYRRNFNYRALGLFSTLSSYAFRNGLVSDFRLLF